MSDGYGFSVKAVYIVRRKHLASVTQQMVTRKRYAILKVTQSRVTDYTVYNTEEHASR